MSLSRLPLDPLNPGAKPSDNPERDRFQMELEFVQCLANPSYLNFLAQRGYLRDKSFINYLSYLLYWKRPEYLAFIKYPNCLFMLDLLQHESFRKELTNPQCSRFIDDQMVLFWQHYTRQRNTMLQNTNAAEQSKATET